MRVLFTTYGFPLYQQSFIEDHVLAMAERGVEVRVLATAAGDHRGGMGGGGLPASVSVRRPSWSDPRLRKVVTLAGVVGAAATHNRAALRRLVTTIRGRTGWRGLAPRLYVIAPALAWDADVVHIGWLEAATTWLDLLTALDRPVVVSSHGSDLRLFPLDDPEYTDRVRRVLARVDLLHCVSEDLAQRAISLGLDQSKVFVGPWGIDTQFFCPFDEPVSRSGPLRVTSVGRIHWVKGYEYALHALREVLDAGIEIDYTILGDADPKARLAVLAAVQDLGLEGRVHFRGLRPREDVRAALRSSDVFLMTSLSEGLSTATLEAMAVALPVVVTDVGGMREAVVDGVSGFVVPARDHSAVADALVALARDASLAEKLGQNGRERVVRDFDIAVCAPKLLEQYHRLAGSREVG